MSLRENEEYVTESTAQVYYYKSRSVGPTTAMASIEPLVDKQEVDGLESLVYSATQALYTKGRGFVPLFPWVFVRVLKKEQVLKSGLILPEVEQNKVVHEGIVLAVYNNDYLHESRCPVAYGDGVYTGCMCGLPPRMKEKCPVEVGDHVLFPHWAGAPVNGYSDQYRVVRATDWKYSEQGGILAVVEYDEADPYETFIDEFAGLLAGELTSTEILKLVREKYVIIDKEKQSVTLSGR